MTAHPPDRAAWILGLLALLAAAGVAAQPALLQDPAYHRFADSRPLGRLPNAWNVLSNAPFLGAGLLGLLTCWRRCELPGRPAWIVAFAGIALVSLGSAWYHWLPSADALVWDRLPMTIGFMGLLVAVLEPSLGAAATRWLLAPAVAAGLGSVAVWHWTGDLRPYVWVQFTPLLLIGATLAIGPLPAPSRRALAAALVLYAIAKVFETADAPLMAATAGAVSGHTLKHLAAAAACGALVTLVRRTVPPDQRGVIGGGTSVPVDALTGR
jgi:hypothetical protein